MNAVDHVVIAVPVRDEEELLPDCLAHLAGAVAALARARPRVTTQLVVALDGCRDGSASLAAAAGATTVELAAVGVGAARDAAVARGVVDSGLTDARVWVACTDADTAVPDGWLLRQVVWAERGADLVVGTVEPVGVTDPLTLAAWHARHQLVEGHGHVHGANLGLRASLWRAVGGFGTRVVHEDVELVERARALTRRWVATETTRVRTSGRRASRVAGAGFGSYLQALADEAIS